MKTKKVERLAYINHALIEHQVKALREQVVESECWFSDDPSSTALRQVNASIDVGAVHLLRLSSSPPTPYVAGRGMLNTRTTLTEATARRGVQLLGWMIQVGADVDGFRYVDWGEYGFALGAEDCLAEPFEVIQDKRSLAETDEGKDKLAITFMHHEFWKAYQQHVMEIEPDDFDMFANLTLGMILPELRMDTKRYYIAILNGPPDQQVLDTLDFFERYALWKNHEASE